MIGGKIIKKNIHADYVEIIVGDAKEGLAIKVKPSQLSKSVQKDDYIWWQGSKAYYTPYDRRTGIAISGVDVTMERIGFSYVPKSITPVKQ